jgi:hypothetical protein
MSRNKRTGPAPNLEALEQDQLKRTREEDEGVNYDDELDQKRILDEAMLDRRGDVLPSERDVDDDRPDQRGSTTVTDEARGETRRKQYEGGADLVSEID